MEREIGQSIRSFPTIGQQLEQWNDLDFTGRSFELHLFDEYLTQLHTRRERIINLHGTGGMGKTRLLEQYRKRAEQRGIRFALVDMRDYMNDPAAIVNQLVRQIYGKLQSNDECRQEEGMRLLNMAAAEERIILAFDHYEESGSMDKWLRESFIPQLHNQVLILIAGRYPLEGSWRVSSAWQKLIVTLPVSELNYEETTAYARNLGITDELVIDTVWLKTLGHPLTLSLFGPIAARAGTAAELAYEQESPFEAIVDQWFQEAPSDELRSLIMTASVPRTFHQEFLSQLMEKEVPLSLFSQLIRLSFIRRSAKGWQMHELVRETIRRTYRDIMPETFEKQRQLTVQIYHRYILNAMVSGQNAAWEVAEMLPHTDNPILRAHFRHSRGSTNCLEAVTEANIGEVEQYIRLRNRQDKDWKIVCSDPESGTSFRYKYTQEQSNSRLSSCVRVREMLRVGGDLQLLRNPGGRMVGLLAAMPIHESTLDYLMKSPVSGPFFSRLTPAQLKTYRTSAEHSPGTYLFAIDVEDMEQTELRSDIIRLLFEFMMSRKILLLSPLPVEFFSKTYQSLGFQPVAGTKHYEYDKKLPAYTYMLDTSGDKLYAFVTGLLQGSEIPKSPSLEKTDHIGELPFTLREREVADLLVRGHTNLEIASALYITVAAVKKHVQSMLQKTGLKNRTQLTSIILEQIK
ncbi:MULTISPECIES: LuxR C-terminal-related transcriptional regulator [unclassified Paenibacillus]|uniref:LuxR C-terminal-related transcriptional regulator n=1 Tax=unclassified Paenibacillus TaxID=185978 RepID=UPI0015A37A14|nr:MULTISPECIES: AAA family ATPase [unclassified Paenibacillus]